MPEELIWDRPEPPSRPALTPLSRERIVAAAIGLADADGLPAVSLRKVAAVLDAGPMRLYGYLSTKEELLDLMVDAVYAEIPGPEAGDWRSALRALAHQLRDATHRHPWFADLVGGRPSLGPHSMAHMEKAVSALAGEPGFEDVDVVMRVVNVVTAYAIGAIRKEVADLRAEVSSGLDERQWQRTVGPYLTRLLATGRYPNLVRVVRDAAHPSRDVVFDEGLDYVLDGVAARLASAPQSD